MGKWTADFTNDPFDDYNIIVEILLDDEDVAVIKRNNDGLELKFYAAESDRAIPVDWLMGLFKDANERLS